MNRVPSRAEVLERLIPYVERHLAAGGRLNNRSRAMCSASIMGSHGRVCSVATCPRMVSEKGRGSTC